MAVTPFLKYCQFISFFIAISANLLLLFLIKKRAGTSFGSYRILMISFSIYALIYSVIEILTMPVLHLQGSGVLFYVDSILKFHRETGVLISALYCGSFALCISMLATHFVFRYVAVCRPHLLSHFDGSKIYNLFVIPLLLFIIWTISIYYNFAPNEIKRDYFRDLAKNIYDEDIDKIAFMGPLYYIRGEKGERLFQFWDILGASISFSIMALCFSTCSLCAFKTYHKLNDNSIEMSERTRAMNKQLFWTLSLQTLLPAVTQYVPVGLMFIFPIFEIDVGRLCNLVGACCCLYPAMDPLIAIFMIDTFRKFILRKSTTKVSNANRGNGSTFGRI